MRYFQISKDICAAHCMASRIPNPEFRTKNKEAWHRLILKSWHYQKFEIRHWGFRETMWWWETQNSYISIGQAHCQHMGMIRMNINTYNPTLCLTKIFWIGWILQRKYTNTTVWSRFLIIKVVCIKIEENIKNLISCSRHRTTKFTNSESPRFTTKFLFWFF